MKGYIWRIILQALEWGHQTDRSVEEIADLILQRLDEAGFEVRRK